MTHAADYADHLVRQTAAVEAFVAVLAQERAALAARPAAYDALAGLTEEKTRRAEQLQRLEDERRERVRVAGADHRLDDAELAAELGCSDLWHRLRARVAHARNQNAVNGTAIQTRLQYTEARLNFLRRHAAQSLYAADGQRRSGSGAGRLRGGA